MTQEQLTLLVAGIGLAGVVVGGLMGFLSTYFVQKLQLDIMKQKEVQAVLKETIDELKVYINEIADTCHTIKKFYLNYYDARQSSKTTIPTDDLTKATDFIREKLYILMTYKLLQDEKLDKFILGDLGTLVNMLLGLQIIGCSDEELDQRIQELNQIIHNLNLTFGNILIRLAMYRAEQFGYREKKRKGSPWNGIKSFFSYFHFVRNQEGENK